MNKAGLRGIVAAVVLISATSMSFEASATRGGQSPPKGRHFAAGDATPSVCPDASVCEATATGTSDGTQVATASIRVDEPVMADQFASGRAWGSKVVKVDQPAEAVGVTFTWQVDEAASSARSTTIEGASTARVWLLGTVRHLGCPDCLVDDPTEKHGTLVGDSYDSGLSSPDGKTASETGSFTHTVTVFRLGGAVPAGSLDATGRTMAFAYVGCASYKSICRPEAGGHAGEASVRTRTRLVSIAVAPTTCPVPADLRPTIGKCRSVS